MKKLKCELVRIKTEDNLQLQGLLFEPEKKSDIALIHIHGWTGNFYENDFIDYIAEAAVSNNLAFLTYNTRAAGHVQEFLRKKGSKTEYVKIGGSLEKFEDCIIDIKAAIGFLDKRGYKNLVLQGHSTGCQKITYYKYKIKDEKVKCLILIEPTDDPPITRRLLGKRFNEAVEIAHKLVNKGKGDSPMPDLSFGVLLCAQKFISMSDPESTEGKIFNYSGKMKEVQEIECPILAIFGANTEYQKEPAEKLEILKKKFKNCDTKLIQANHWFFGHEAELGKIISDWIKKNV